jgi:integrase
MSRITQFKPKKNKNEKWELNVPASFSPTGKRLRLQFKTKKLAELEAQRLKRQKLKWGSEGGNIRADLAADAEKASAILAPFGITIVAAAKHYEEEMKNKSSSKTFAELWKFFSETREVKSDAHKATIRKVDNKLTPIIGHILVCDLKHSHLRKVIKCQWPTPHGFNLIRRTVSPAFNLAIQEEWASENPCKRIEPIDTGRVTIKTLNLSQCCQLFESFNDYRKDESLPVNLRVDCRGALAAFAVMTFGGVRPHETERLEWRDVDMIEGTVKVSSQKAKTNRSRYFEMPDTLLAWLSCVPLKERDGDLCPPNWKRIYQAVRKVVGIGTDKDILRKSFVTFHLAAYKEINKTRAIIGHEVGDVVFQHYRGLATRKDGEAFFEILPNRDHK